MLSNHQFTVIIKYVVANTIQRHRLDAATKLLLVVLSVTDSSSTNDVQSNVTCNSHANWLKMFVNQWCSVRTIELKSRLISVLLSHKYQCVHRIRDFSMTMHYINQYHPSIHPYDWTTQWQTRYHTIIIIIKNECHSNIIVNRLQCCDHSKNCYQPQTYCCLQTNYIMLELHRNYRTQKYGSHWKKWIETKIFHTLLLCPLT